MKIKERLVGAFYGWKHGPQRDQLTGLFTRSLFEREIWPREVARAKRYGRPLSIVLIDMDRLREINNSKGHLAGDRAIRGLVAGIWKQVRRSDILIRHGGDEFLLLLPETDELLARNLMDRIQEKMAKMTIGFSFGVAEWKNGPKELEALIGEADKELYAQKEGKRNKGD